MQQVSTISFSCLCCSHLQVSLLLWPKIMFLSFKYFLLHKIFLLIISTWSKTWRWVSWCRRPRWRCPSWPDQRGSGASSGRSRWRRSAADFILHFQILCHIDNIPYLRRNAKFGGAGLCHDHPRLGLPLVRLSEYWAMIGQIIRILSWYWSDYGNTELWLVRLW